jgi:monoamine oxidase
VLEARDRVGGRTWSRTLPTGATVEMGAEFILPGNTEVAALAERLGLGLWGKGMYYGQREPRGGIGTDQAAIAIAVEVVEEALAALEGSPTVRELLDRLRLDPGAAEAILARAEISSASSADDIPATDLAGVAHIGPELSPSVAGGNQGLSLGLDAALGDAVRLGDPATLVEWSVDGARVTTASGFVAEGDSCVIAVPASVLNAIEFAPELPAPKREAFASVRYGHAAKLFVPLAEPAPTGAVMNVSERYWCWTATGAGDVAMPIVSCFAGSPGALDRLEVTAGPDRWLESLAALRPDLPLDPAGAVLSTWDDDPWVRGAYSIFPPPELTAALAEPVGPLAFCGEHVGGAFNGLMEGALRSGRAAAAAAARARR